MKKITLFILVLTFTFQNKAYSQNISDLDVALIAFNVTIMSDAFNKLDPHEPRSTREKSLFTKSKKVLNQLVNDAIYADVIQNLSETKNITIRDKDAMVDGRVIYNEYGYPFPFSAKGGIKKARKNGVEAEGYLKVSVTVSAALDVLGGAKLSKNFKPECSVNITFLGPDGKALTQGKGKKKAKKPIRAKDFPGSSFDKLDASYMSHLKDEMMPYLNEAVKSAVSKL